MADDEPSYKRRHLVPLKIAERRNLVVGYDGAGYINAAYQPNPFLIDVLLARKFIKAEHHFYGMQMIAMHRVFLDPVLTKVGMLRVKTEDEASPSKPIPIEDIDYLRILRELRNDRWKRIVALVCTDDADPRLIDQLERIEGTVWMAFSELSTAVKALWERKEAAIKNQYGE